MQNVDCRIAYEDATWMTSDDARDVAVQAGLYVSGTGFIHIRHNVYRFGLRPLRFDPLAEDGYLELRVIHNGRAVMLTVVSA